MRPFRGFGFVWLVVELVVFFLVANWIGIFPTILLVILPMIFGGGIMQIQGTESMRQAEAKMAKGESPESEMLESMAIFMGGMLMLIPGLISSVIGIALLIPGLRRRFLAWLLSKGIIRTANGQPFKPDQGHVIEGEFKRD